MTLVVENLDGIEVKYKAVNYSGKNARIYILPGVPLGAGDMPGDRLEVGDALSFLDENLDGGIPEYARQRVKNILASYKGRRMDTMFVLRSAIEKNKFEEYADKLEKTFQDFERIPSIMRNARTDISAFFWKLYLELGDAEEEAAASWIDFNNEYGPGLLVFNE